MDTDLRTTVDPVEQDTLARAIRVWLNTYSDKPSKVGYEYLSDTGMAMTTIQDAYYTRRYIDGSYEAKYEFRLVNRLFASSDDERLTADEDLNKFGRWITTSTPPTISNIRIKKIERNIAALYARYENGVEDHTIDITITYEVYI